MYKLIGTRKNGIKVLKKYSSNDEKVARFEFEIICPVATKLELFENDILIDSYEYRQPEVVTYLLNGKTAFSNISKRITRDKKIALIEFNNEKSRCDWLTLYEEKNGDKTLLECFVKGA